MDNIKIGRLIAEIRKDKKLTQKQLADKLRVSDKTISKWERGLGCPDIDIMKDLAEILEVNVTELLSGDMFKNDNDTGNMSKTKFYVCPKCGNVITSTNNLIINCCGKRLTQLTPCTEIDEEHMPILEVVEDDLFIHINHEMEKQHYISFIAYVTTDKLMLGKLYPEQNAEIRFKRSGHGMIYVYCKKHGLWGKRI